MTNKFLNRIICGDALSVLKRMPNDSVDCCVTSPPYYNLRDYGSKNQIGLETDFNHYLDRLLAVFAEIRRVLKPAGTCWVNLGDTYGGSGANLSAKYNRAAMRNRFLPKGVKAIPGKAHVRGQYAKSLLQIPARFAVRMIDTGWLLRNEIIWHKPNCVPSSAKDRFTVDFEKLFFFVKSRRYYFDQQFEPLASPERLQRRYFNLQTKRKWDYEKDRAVPVNPQAVERSRAKILARGRNKRCVWRISPAQFAGNHFAVFPEKLIETPILAGCPPNGVVLDPFVGSGTTAVVARIQEEVLSVLS